MDRLTQSLSKLRRLVASPKAEEILIKDVVNALGKAWQFETSSGKKKELAIVYHKTIEQSDIIFCGQVWDEYFSDFEPWLIIPILPPEMYIKTLAHTQTATGAGTGYPGVNAERWIVKETRRLDGDEDREEPESNMDARMYTFLQSEGQSSFYLRDLVVKDKAFHYVIGKLWQVTKQPNGEFLLVEVP